MRNGSRRLSRVALVLVGGGISVSLLFWAKLRLVTQIPRTTYAEPASPGDAADRPADESEGMREDDHPDDPGS